MNVMELWFSLNICQKWDCWIIQWFYEDLQDIVELIPQKDVLLIIGDWNAKVERQETPGVTGNFGLRVQNEAGQIGRAH